MNSLRPTFLKLGPSMTLDNGREEGSKGTFYWATIMCQALVPGALHNIYHLVLRVTLLSHFTDEETEAYRN